MYTPLAGGCHHTKGLESGSVCRWEIMPELISMYTYVLMYVCTRDCTYMYSGASLIRIPLSHIKVS